ncbi:hypothetical protein U1Q18_011794 [Sarracenia purpurea var. burkii]
MGRRPKHRPSFFKVLIGDFATKLRIPPAFLASFEGEFPATATIKTNNGESWPVKIEQIEKNHFFAHRGWQNVVKDCQLDVGDFLVFRLIPDWVFEITIYAPSGCEKEQKPAIKTESSVAPTISEQNKENPSTATTTRSLSKDTPARAYSNNRSSREVDEHPCFLVVFKEYNRYYMTVPKAFAIETGILSKKGGVVLRNDEGKVWGVDMCVRSNGRIDMGAGWTVFRAENKISNGDTCLFEFIPTAGNLVHVEVRKRKTANYN